ncbi:MAG: ArsA family ATPase [Oscillatoriophycideae cyanobacterium NC_groundwater_1537_Pr4_S-0.65um_50_18]|nr:ArsA family ATPase [Oscillatoriophycideae cyanobacterium NC_groundwater_1537_Pr4_S-0.65um_50_18]
MYHFDPLHLALFSGKGGVGKTTLSCGFARNWAQRFPTERILLLSTDPAHSLGDVLQIAVGDVPTALSDLPNLQVRSLDAQALLQAFKADYGKVLEILVERGSFVQGEDLSPIWDLSWPGLDELMGILEIQRLLREQEADRVVVDMAPSGHTLNLFGLMDFLDGFLGALDLFQEKHRVMTQRFAGRYTADESDRFLSEMKADLASGRQLLQDPLQTACCVVAIAEPMSYLETHRFIEALHSLQIPVGGLFVNHLSLDRPTSEQQDLLKKFEAIGVQPSFGIPQQPQEPVGFAAIDHLISQLQPLDAALLMAPAVKPEFSLPTKLLPSLPNFLVQGRRLILVGGKGGVGKTTVAGAIAWRLAQDHPDKKIRVISIDPAHSLGDALAMPLAHQPTQITANLSAQEIDAKQVLEQFREDYLWELAEMMSGDTGDESLQIAYTPQAWRQIVAQALPGIDEMLSLITVMELLERGEQDLIVLDTAPTGHLLRFLEMPTALADWLAWIFKLWIKYQDVVGRTELMGRLRTLRQRVMQTQKKLKDAHHTEFVGVLQAQSAIVLEAERLTHSLATLGVSQHYIVHNRFEPDQSLSADFSAQTIVRLPQLPRGVPSLMLIEQAAELLF